MTGTPLLSRGPLIALGVVILLVTLAWGVGVELARLVTESRRHDRLHVQTDALLSCNQEKETVAHELLAGRLSLEQAAREFHRLEEQRRASGDHGPDGDLDTEEALWRSVLSWVEASLGQAPGRDDVRRRLQAELAQRFPREPQRGP